MAFGNCDIVLNTSHLRRKQNLIARVRGSVLPASIANGAAVSFRLADQFHFDGGRDFHSNDQRVVKIHRVVHRHGLGKARLDQRPDEAGYKRRRQDGRPHRPRSDPTLGRFVIGVEGGLLCQFFSTAGEQGLCVRSRSKDPAYAGRLSDKIIPNNDAVASAGALLFRVLEQVPHWLVCLSHGIRVCSCYILIRP
jgi:hypothetical protein